MMTTALQIVVEVLEKDAIKITYLYVKKIMTSLMINYLEQPRIKVKI